MIFNATQKIDFGDAI
jgi:hypothetical protein